MPLQRHVGRCLLDWGIALVKSAIFEVMQRVHVDREHKECICVCMQEKERTLAQSYGPASSIK